MKQAESTMSSPHAQESSSRYGVDPGTPHTFHDCHNVDEFRRRFEEATGCPVQHTVDDIVAETAPKALFLVGSIPLGMASSASDIDFIALVDSRNALLNREGSIANNDRQLEFSNETDALLAGMFLLQKAGVYLDVQVAITPEIHRVYSRLRRRGPELSESEIRTLGRLGTGWLLWQSEGYLERNRTVLSDPMLGVYCCTKNFVSALIHRRKALKALDGDDIVLALHLGRSSVELAYLAYFASEGMPYLGAKWPAQVGHAREASERLSRHPLLKQGTPLLFPSCQPGLTSAHYLRDTGDFLTSMRRLIEQKTLFRIAFEACPQIGPV
jgi:hypothetical protein